MQIAIRILEIVEIVKIFIHLSSVRPTVPGCREALVQELSPVDPYMIAALPIIL